MRINADEQRIWGYRVKKKGYMDMHKISNVHENIRARLRRMLFIVVGLKWRFSAILKIRQFLA